MTDIHCHILHGIDDGPVSMKQSMDLIRMAESNGIRKIVLTPHMLQLDLLDEFLTKRDSKIKELEQIISESDIDIALFPGAEVYISDDIFYSSDLRSLTINNSRYILSEFKYTNLSEKRLFKYLDELLSQGLVPIIAHPERYEYFQDDSRLVNMAAQMGALFQVNIDALCGLSGRAEARIARELVHEGLASFIATDAHSVEHRPNNLLEKIGRYLGNINEHLMELLVNSNPEAVLRDELVFTTEHRLS